MKNTLKRVLSLFVVFSLVFSAVPAAFAAEHSAENETTANTLSTGGSMSAAGIVTVAQTTNNLAPGVTQTELITRNAGNQQNMGYLTVVDLNQDVTLKASYNGYYTAGSTADSRAAAAGSLGWSFETTTGQAAAFESAADTEGTVVMATNGDYFNMGTGEPLGYLIMEGNAIKSTGEPYFAILNDGTAVIRDAGTDHTDVAEAISGPFYLIKDGVIVADRNDASQMPRNSVGVRADGSVVFYLNDGRQAPVSVGMTLYETAAILLDAGCVDALYLDGGGSATVAARTEGSAALKVVNSPSDGQEREVSSAMLVVSTAKATGVFDHAAISPKNELYTPGSTVQFTAAGVDTAGAAVEIPADVQWALASESKEMGTIDANGLFTAGDKTGEVTVIMTQNGNNVGAATIEIVTPDHIYFNSDEISLGFEASTDLGLVVRYQNRDVNYKVGDIVWTCSNDALGTFNGNIFTASDGESLNGNITATSAFDSSVSGTIHVIVGMLPTIVWDFEDVINEDGTVIAAEDYYGGLLTHGNYGRGGKESIEIVSIDDDEPVRFGEKSLKLNYDFTQCLEVTEGAIVGTSESFTVPGTPTGIGVWVYAPEGVGITWKGDGTQAGFWLRGYVNNGSGTTVPYDFTLEPKAISPEMAAAGVQPGIYWEGWMYLEADLTNIQPPYSILRGNTFRLMFVNGTMMGTRTANAIYFDNLQFVYGTNVDDVDSPKVDSITIGSNELNDGDVLSSNTVTIRTTFSDVQNKYTSGIDANTVRMFIDGVNVVDNDKYQFALNANDGYAELYDLTLADGVHSVTVSMRDNFGNDVEETRFFTVQGGLIASTAVTVAPLESIASLGGVVTLEIRATDSSVVTSDTTIRLSNMFPDYEVVFAENYEGTYKYSKTNRALTVSATRNAESENTLIAKVIVKVPATLTENETFLYEITSGSYSTAGGFYGTYSAPEKTLPVGAGIAVSCDPILVGGELAHVKVTDLEGNGVANAGIYLTDGTLIGTTDENGLWETDYFSSSASKVAVYAQTADGLLSFQYHIYSYEAAVEAANGPASVIFNTPADSTTQKSITWTSSPLSVEAQSIRYRVQGTEEWTSVAAETTLLTFITGGNLAANANSVVLTGLTAGTTYEYQVGGGEIWTEIAEFTTNAADEASTEFFVMADVQADDFTNVYNMIAKINEGGYDFGIQTGDAIDNVTSYSQVATALDLFSTKQLGELDMIRVLGNHEYYGDANAEITSTLYGISESKPGSCYSVTVGDVYVAVINFTNTNAELLPALEWLKEDAKASDATWKVLTMHQPPYYTYTGGGNAPINTYVPAAAEEAGIDVVFSGHDHALARTNQLTGGEIDTENGILYYIGGSSGEKSYPVNSQDVFDYETVFALATTDFSATYIGVTADKYQMTLNIYDVLADGTQNVVDTYTLKSHMGLCAEAGHELENAVYDNGVLICNECGDTVDPAEIKFTGWAVHGETGRSMLFFGGVAQTGETLFGQDVYYFDENGVAYDGVVIIDEVEMEFDNGLLIGGYTGFIKKTDGNTYHYEDGMMTYGWFEHEGNWYHFNTATGVMNTQTHVMPDDEAKSKNAYYDFAEDGRLLYGYFNPHGYYYWAGLPAADQWVKLSSDPDAWYRTNGNGHYVTDRSANPTVVIAVDGVEYTFDNTNGKLLKGSIVNDNGTLYYYWAGEPVNDGWFELDGNTYYAYADGHLAQGSNTIDGETYMFDMDGVLVTEGMILTAALNAECNTMTIKLVNADDSITNVRIALWPGDDQETLMWLDAKQDAQGMWIVTTPMCTFTNEVPAVFSVHAFTGEESDQEFLMATTVEIPVAEHTYTDHRDTVCNLCGFEREVEIEIGETTPMFRLYNPNSGEHFYTGSVEERENLMIAGWQYEGVAWNAPVNSGEHVYRLYNPNSGDHHYTMSADERDWLVSLGWQYEGVAWNSAGTDGVPQFRLYNPNADCGSHHYTSSTEERDYLVSLGWQYEGIGWYGTLN